MILKKDIETPHMFDQFSAVGERLDFLPETHIYVVEDVQEAVGYIEGDGRGFFQAS
jgi:hypothetical protein